MFFWQKSKICDTKSTETSEGIKNLLRHYFSYIFKIKTSILTILNITTIKTKNCVQEQNVSILHSTIIINLNRIIFISVLIYHKLVQLIATLYD